MRWIATFVVLLLSGCGSHAGSTGAVVSVPSAPPASTSPPEPTALPPAVLPTPDGWKTGASSDPGTPAEETFTWAATLAYRDVPFSAPPQTTLNAMSPGDVLVEVFLWRPSAEDVEEGNVFREPALPFTLDATAAGQDYPGGDGSRWFQRTEGAVGGRQIDIWVFAGRPHPTSEQVAAAQSVVDDIVLPPWPSTPARIA
jgi:hypothetical protein